jgi:hypothetical protein
MYESQTWALSKFLGEEHFEEGAWASNWVRDLQTQNQPRNEGIL